MAFPLVSILIANHNNSQYIGEALDSVVNQTYPNIEIILVEDASTDNSKEVIDDYIEAHPNAKILLYQNGCSFGCGKAKRKCADIARGKYFAFLDPDDVIALDAVEKLVGIHEKCDGYSIVYSTHYLCDEKLKVKSVSTWAGKIPEGDSNLTSKTGHVSAFALCKKSCYDQTTGINPEYVVAEDQDMYFKLEETAPVCFYNEPLYYYRKHDHNMSYDDDKEVRNAYWLMLCKDAAYHRRKQLFPCIPNLTKRDLQVCRLEYYLKDTKARKQQGLRWAGSLFKVVLFSVFSVRKGFRGIRAILSR